MKPIIKIFVVSLLAASGLAVDASAADVRAGISTRETFVGLPVTLQIQVANAIDFDPPTMPDVPGLRIESLGQPSRSSNVTWINGNITKRISVIYSFAVTPMEPGTFHIPAISVRADGQTLSTKPIDFAASKSETGDLLFVEIEGKEKQIYVGQALDLMLKIWVRPYSDKEHGITLSEGDMWQLLSQRTNWGPFQARIEELAASNQRPVGVEELRKDRDGNNHNYYLYEIDGTIYPKKPGKIDANDVQVVVLYPTAIGQSRDPFERMFEDMGMPGGRRGMFGGGSSMFGPRLEVESVRPIVADVKVEPIEVLDIPVADRPADYRGAVGKYRIVAHALDKDVKAGDPITFQLILSGTGPMDLVQAPPLAELPALTRDFKVPNEPLAGVVQGASKGFSTTIRPRKEGITEIPPIPFTYFDPEVGKFVTTTSAPITIHVDPAETLALADVVGRNHAASNSNGPTSAAPAAGGPQFVNYTLSGLLQNESAPTAISSTTWGLLALPPIAVLVLALVRGRSGISALTFWLGSSARQFQRRIEQASQPSDVERALRLLIAERFGMSTGADSAALVGALRSAGYRSIAVRSERLFQQCEALSARPLGSGVSLAELQREALEVVHELQTTRRPARTKSAAAMPAARLRTTTTAVVALALAGALFATGQEARAAALDEGQRQTLLAEANEIYSTAVGIAAKDSAEAKQGFSDAAEKYQLVVDSGIQNGQLYFNLGNAYLQSGQTGRAIANYRRTLRLDPTNKSARTNLAYAETLLKKSGSGVAQAQGDSIAELAVVANGWLNRFVSPTTILVIAIVSWIGFWAAIGLRLCDVRVPWKTLAACALIVCAIAATSYAASCQSVARSEAIVISSDTALRTGDGKNFPTVTGATLTEGEQIEWLKRRGDWVQVRTAQGQTGWMPGTAVELL